MAIIYNESGKFLNGVLEVAYIECHENDISRIFYMGGFSCQETKHP